MPSVAGHRCLGQAVVPFNTPSRSMEELPLLSYLAKTSSDFKMLAPVRLVNRQIIWHSDSPLNCVLNIHPTLAHAPWSLGWRSYRRRTSVMLSLLTLRRLCPHPQETVFYTPWLLGLKKLTEALGGGSEVQAIMLGLFLLRWAWGFFGALEEKTWCLNLDVGKQVPRAQRVQLPVMRKEITITEITESMGQVGSFERRVTGKRDLWGQDTEEEGQTHQRDSWGGSAQDRKKMGPEE